MVRAKDTQIFQKSRIHLKILGVARRTWRQCRTDDLHKSDVAAWNFLATTTATPDFVPHWAKPIPNWFWKNAFGICYTWFDRIANHSKASADTKNRAWFKPSIQRLQLFKAWWPRYFHFVGFTWLVPVSARSKAWVCGCLFAGIAGLSPDGGVIVCLLWMLCVVK
jgi:hypothetical protein